MKVATIVGTRPEVIKLSRVIAELDACCEHVLIHTGQNYDYTLNQVFFDQLAIRKPDYFLEVAGENLGETIGNVIARSYDVLLAEAPDALLLLGDTNSCLSVISAKRLKIPVFHMEAGNRCFDERVPEEINRRMIDHASDINLPYTEHARRYLLAEGLRPDTVIKTGSPMREVLNYYRSGIESSDAMTRLGLQPHAYLLVSAHREENVDDSRNLRDLLDTLRALYDKHRMPVIVSTHPRTRKRLDELGIGGNDAGVRFIEALGFLDYVNLEMNAGCVLSDSGTITEESSILGFPAVTIRQAHERPEGMDEGTLIMCGLKRDRVLEAVDTVVRQHAGGERAFRMVPDYEPDNVSKKVVRHILSYTDYVNRVVWRKQL
ncbi:MAG TPA: UDP-N-acetylglucosamine 2-epimerase (non-hydrolyzing) [Burkholderiales bacterium]|nr:UDP-N-acetylglucosamine 2-epimerase (non-hydrolyzing) [Burkholderiales bacterium]